LVNLLINFHLLLLNKDSSHLYLLMLILGNTAWHTATVIQISSFQERPFLFLMVANACLKRILKD